MITMINKSKKVEAIRVYHLASIRGKTLLVLLFMTPQKMLEILNCNGLEMKIGEYA